MRRNLSRCALLELPVAAEALGASAESLQGNVSATVTLVGVFRG